MLIDWLHPAKWMLLPQMQKFKKLRKKNKRDGENAPHDKAFVRKVDKYLNKLNLILEALADIGEDAGPRVTETLQRHLKDGRFYNLHHLQGIGAEAARHAHHHGFGHGHGVHHEAHPHHHHDSGHHNEHHAKAQHHEKHEHHKSHVEKHKSHKSHAEHADQTPWDGELGGPSY